MMTEHGASSDRFTNGGIWHSCIDNCSYLIRYKSGTVTRRGTSKSRSIVLSSRAGSLAGLCLGGFGNGSEVIATADGFWVEVRAFTQADGTGARALILVKIVRGGVYVRERLPCNQTTGVDIRNVERLSQIASEFSSHLKRT